MKIAIIGAGNIGGALARGLDKKGHQITIGARDPAGADLQTLAKSGKHIAAETIPNAVKPSDIVIIAVPLKAIPGLVPVLGDLTGKMIIETSNVFGQPLPMYITGAQAIKALSGNDDVVKAFNTIGAEDLADPLFGNSRADTFMAGESKKAKAAVAGIAKDMGFENCFDLGGDEALPLLDSLAAVWAAIAYKGHLGRRCAFKVLYDKS